jgi:hypothetical protein
MPHVRSYQASHLKVFLSFYPVYIEKERQQDCKHYTETMKSSERIRRAAVLPLIPPWLHRRRFFTGFRRSRRRRYTTWDTAHYTLHSRKVDRRRQTGVESFWNRRTLYKKQHRRMLKWRGSTRIKIYLPSYILSRKYKFPMTSTASKEKPREPFDHVPRSISTLLSCKKDSITEWQTWWHTQIVHLSYLTLDK